MAGLSVLTHTHTPPARNTHGLSPLRVTSTLCSFLTVVHPHADTPLSTIVLERWCTPICILSIVGSSMHKLGSVCPHGGTVVCSLPSRAGVHPFSRSVWKSVFFSSSAWFMYVLPVTSFPKGELLFFPVVSYAH